MVHQPGLLKLQFRSPSFRLLDVGDPRHIRPILNTHRRNEYPYQSAFREHEQGVGKMACSPASNWGKSLATGRQATLLPLHLPTLEWDISVATIPSDKGSDIPPTPPTVDLRMKRARCSDGYWVSDFFISSQGFFIVSLYHHLHVFTWLCKNS